MPAMETFRVMLILPMCDMPSYLLKFLLKQVQCHWEQCQILKMFLQHYERNQLSVWQYLILSSTFFGITLYFRDMISMYFVGKIFGEILLSINLFIYFYHFQSITSKLSLLKSFFNRNQQCFPPVKKYQAKCTDICY